MDKILKEEIARLTLKILRHATFTLVGKIDRYDDIMSVFNRNNYIIFLSKEPDLNHIVVYYKTNKDTGERFLVADVTRGMGDRILNIDIVRVVDEVIDTEVVLKELDLFYEQLYFEKGLS